MRIAFWAAFAGLSCSVDTQGLGDRAIDDGGRADTGGVCGALCMDVGFTDAVVADAFEADSSAPDANAPDASVPDADGECSMAGDCPPEASLSVCTMLGIPEGVSCLAGFCVAECGSAGRTCETPSDTCIDCEGVDRVCVNQCASAGIDLSFNIEQATCATWPSSGAPFVGSAIRVVDDPDITCSYVAFEGAREIGRYHLLTDFTLLAWFPEFGGACTGIDLPTGVQRILFNCPTCQFVFGL